MSIGDIGLSSISRTPRRGVSTNATDVIRCDEGLEADPCFDRLSEGSESDKVDVVCRTARTVGEDVMLGPVPAGVRRSDVGDPVGGPYAGTVSGALAQGALTMTAAVICQRG